MIVLRGMAVGVILSTLVIGIVGSVMNPDLGTYGLVRLYWGNFTLLLIAIGVFAFTEWRSWRQYPR